MGEMNLLWVKVKDLEKRIHELEITVNNTRAKSASWMIKPTYDEVVQFVQEERLTVQPGQFWDFYESNGWKVGRNPMKDWKAALRTWERNQKTRQATYTQRPSHDLSANVAGYAAVVPNKYGYIKGMQ